MFEFNFLENSLTSVFRFAPLSHYMSAAFLKNIEVQLDFDHLPLSKDFSVCVDVVGFSEMPKG